MISPEFSKSPHKDFEPRTKIALREGVEQWMASHEEIQKADPLNVNNFFSTELPRLNQKADKEGLVVQAEHMVQLAQPLLQSGDNVAASAAKRDLGMVLASITRHGGDIQEVSGLEETLVSFSAKTGEAPTLTINDYTLYNSQEKGTMRTFTGHSFEKFLIEKTYEGRKGLPYAICDLYEASQADIFDSHHASLIKSATAHIAPMATTMAVVRKEEGLNEFFTHEVQPYFRAKITVDGKAYDGAGGGQIEIGEIDKITWPTSWSGKDKKEVDTFHKAMKTYLSPPIREISDAIDRDCPKSLVDILNEDSKNALEGKTEEEIDNARNAFQATYNLLLSLNRFRNVHNPTAKESLEEREKKEGSGGFDAKFLDNLKSLTNQARESLNPAGINLQVPNWRPYTSSKKDI